ncbi:PEP-CTERM sorting domain-containing protein [Nostoc sp. CCY0012]|uniref:PEP-CTERM sorting domain-containing protein n=1 Tax=Nostoc sp. CCY0012 TaxID=1056123 RepID=UPI0039C60E03
MINKFSALLASAAIATGTVATLAVAPAHAAKIKTTTTTTTGSCSLTDVTYNSGVAATSCIGELEIGSSGWAFQNDVLGNGDPLLSKLNQLFAVNYDWSFVGKDETTGKSATAFDGYSDAKTGTWSVTQPINGPFAISLKASTGFSVYLFETFDKAITSGTWATLGLLNNGGKQPNLSHISLFTASYIPPHTPTPKPVPEPGSLVALGLVASGIVMSRRRTLAN